MLRPSLSFPNGRDVLAGTERQIAGYLTAAMRDATAGLKTELRAQVTGAGLGGRLANTWRGETYPKERDALNPAGYVYSNAPAIIDSFSRGATIAPLGGKRFLWIPTANVPRDRNAPRGSQRKASPHEVELQFNQDLIIRRGKGRTFLAFVKVVQAKNRRGFRQATPRRLAAGRDLNLVLMFVLTPTVRVPKKLDLEGAANHWAGQFPQLLDARWR